jgi:hypothetical protein
MMLDKFQQLAWDATYAVCILGNPEASDFELVELGTTPLTEEHRRRLSERGMGFVGVFGIVNGVPHVALAVPLDERATSALSQALVQRSEDAINAVEEAIGDSTEFLKRLYTLPDNRHGAN